MHQFTSVRLWLLRGLIFYAPPAAVAHAFDLLSIVRALQSYKSGLPPGAGGGSGDNIRVSFSRLAKATFFDMMSIDSCVVLLVISWILFVSSKS